LSRRLPDDAFAAPEIKSPRPQFKVAMGFGFSWHFQRTVSGRARATIWSSSATATTAVPRPLAVKSGWPYSRSSISTLGTRPADAVRMGAAIPEGRGTDVDVRAHAAADTAARADRRSHN
jgi:hypothetical protein